LAQAQARGLSPENYLTAVIESQMLLVEPPPATLEEFEAALEAFADDSDDMPVLPAEALPARPSTATITDAVSPRYEHRTCTKSLTS
jgi:hypothetical protein